MTPWGGGRGKQGVGLLSNIVIDRVTVIKLGIVERGGGVGLSLSE